jgi:hypothetical protein
LPLIHPADVVPYEEHIRVLNMPVYNSPNPDELGPRLNRNKLAEQIELPAEIIHVPTAAGPTEDCALVVEDLPAEGRHRLRQ